MRKFTKVKSEANDEAKIKEEVERRFTEKELCGNKEED